MNEVLPLQDQTVKVILLDIEGTTTPVEFVYKVLFPYARDHVHEFLLEQIETVRTNVDQLRAQHEADKSGGLNPPSWVEETATSRLNSAVVYVHWLMEQDRKATALKALQGQIWERGYQNGTLRGEIYPDVPRAFARWQRQKKKICIYSSGSVLAQQLLFSHTTEGDLTGFIARYFDTTTGPKTSSASYRRIVTELDVQSSELLFVSDSPAELDAAQEARIRTALCARGGCSNPVAGSYPVIHSFDEILPAV